MVSSKPSKDRIPRLQLVRDLALDDLGKFQGLSEDSIRVLVPMLSTMPLAKLKLHLEVRWNVEGGFAAWISRVIENIRTEDLTHLDLLSIGETALPHGYLLKRSARTLLELIIRDRFPSQPSPSSLPAMPKFPALHKIAYEAECWFAESWFKGCAEPGSHFMIIIGQASNLK